ncbi:hypothetical protein MTO96_030411 [Rhipicephalus appendiculatus]
MDQSLVNIFWKIRKDRKETYEEVAVEVIFGKGDGRNTSRLPPLYAHRGAGRYAPEYTLDAIRAARENKAEGIELDLSFTRDNVGVLFHDDSLERTTSDGGVLAYTSFEELATTGRRQQEPGLQRYDNRAVSLLGVLFSQTPELYRRGLVSSPNPDFIYALRYKNPNIVTALTWRPGLLAYEDAEKRRPRYEPPVKHYKAVVADWLLEQALNTGLLHHMTGASAVLLWKDNLNFDSVRMWRDRGVHVIAWTPNKRAEKDYFRRVLRVPIMTDSLEGKARRKDVAEPSYWWPGTRLFSAIWTRAFLVEPNQCMA